MLQGGAEGNTEPVETVDSTQAAEVNAPFEVGSNEAPQTKPELKEVNMNAINGPADALAAASLTSGVANEGSGPTEAIESKEKAARITIESNTTDALLASNEEADSKTLNDKDVNVVHLHSAPPKEEIHLGNNGDGIKVGADGDKKEPAVDEGIPLKPEDTGAETELKKAKSRKSKKKSKDKSKSKNSKKSKDGQSIKSQGSTIENGSSRHVSSDDEPLINHIMVAPLGQRHSFDNVIPEDEDDEKPLGSFISF
jgi:hypothetical protein